MGVPQWILELPQKFLSSPMGMMLRPILEQMQITNTAPTNVPNQTTSFAPTSSASGATTTTNPWANIPAETSTSSKTTPLLDKQTALLSTDSNVVKICIVRLQPEQGVSELLSKLSDTKVIWKEEEIESLHSYLRSIIIQNDKQQMSYALMLLRLVVLKGTNSIEQSQSTQLVASLLIENKLASFANRSMAWCVLSNAIGSSLPPAWSVTDTQKFVQLVEKALSDCDCSKDDAQQNIPLRQSAAAFLYNSARHLTIGTAGGDESDELPETTMSILLGCIDHIQEETDVTTLQRLYMATGQLLKSSNNAVRLVKDLGMVDNLSGRKKEVEGLAKEIRSLLE